MCNISKVTTHMLAVKSNNNMKYMQLRYTRKIERSLIY